jgi:small-conductance mechanosensitive channel
MSPNITDHLAQGKVARITGGFFIAYIVASVLATMLGQIGLGDAQQVYQAIVTNEASFRLGLVIALMTGFLFLVTAWGLYVLLRPVNKNLALLFLLLNAVGVAIQGASMLFLVSAMLQGDGASSMQAFSAAQLEGAGVAVHQRLQSGLCHGPAVLRHVVVPARLSGLQVRVPSPVPGHPSAA